MTTTIPHPLCRDDADDTKPCPFAGTCHDDRQKIQHHYALRGTDCWAYQLLVVQRAYDPQPKESAQP